LTEKYPHHNFSIIIGSDSLNNIQKWKNYQALLQKFTVFVYTRPGHPVTSTYLENIKIVQAPLLEISSTMIRDFIKTGKSIQYLVPEMVREEIEKNNYYRNL
jgi:nicotinate-nucleotide adenylyltransferase